MAKCNKCSQEIEFKPHPVSGKLTPFSGGEIHFAVCSKRKDDSYTARVDPMTMACPRCNAPAKYIFWNTYRLGRRIRIAFDCVHNGGLYLAETEKNKSLINCTEADYCKDRIRLGRDAYGFFEHRIEEIKSREE